ncbi:MAG: hypothetical protein ABW215_00175 [Kibdelosporangium sp.]
MLRSAVVGALALTGVLLVGGTAAADPIFNYDITTGTSTIKKLNSNLPLGPGNLVVDLDGASGNFTADLGLPPAQGKFTLLGIFPTTATIVLEEAQPTVGTLVDGVVESHSKVTIRLKDVKAVGLPLFVGDNCRTKTPADIVMHSAPEFNPLEGGDLVGTYTIPEFVDCNLSTLLLNGLIPGPDNKITLTLAIKW